MPDATFDVVLAGAGLAGACAALHLAAAGRAVALLEAGQPGDGASGVAAGLVNPLMGRRAGLVWQGEAALDALRATLALAEAEALWQAGGLLRPAADAAQATRFQEAARRHPPHATWHPAARVAAQHPDVAAPHGALHVRTGGALDVGAFVGALVAAATRQGLARLDGHRVAAWGEVGGHAWLDVEGPEGPLRLAGRHVVLCLGSGFRAFPALAALPLHAVKGQTVQVAPPPHAGPVPPLAGRGYVVPGPGAWTIGSSYEHDFADLAPTPAVTASLLAQAAALVPSLAQARPLGAAAGLRVGVPGTRKPLLAPLPDHRRVWIFTGLGSKGLLMAPLLGRLLPHALAAPALLPPEVHLPR